jgi:hypothetical protein
LLFSITNLKLENLKKNPNPPLVFWITNLKLENLKKNPKPPQCGRFSNSLQSSFHSKNLWLFSMGGAKANLNLSNFKSPSWNRGAGMYELFETY